MMILAGTTAVVTGGAVRIGRAIGRSLAEQGVNICLHYGHSADAARTAVEEFRALGVQATAVQADLAQPLAAARHVFESAGRELGEVHILVNNAGIFEAGSLLTTDEENWDRHLTINLKAPFFLTQQFVQQLPRAGEGAVVNIVDWRGERPVPGHDAYTIAKTGLVAQTRLLAQELGPRVRVNAVAPGAILPPPGESQDAFSQRAELNLLEKTGFPDDITEAVLYLLRASFVTGEVLHVTGGQQLRQGF